jgi:protein associated with RNAse G/E
MGMPKKNNMGDVFCKECKYLEPSKVYYRWSKECIYYYCNHPNNFTTEKNFLGYYDVWITPFASDRNKKCNCKDFEKKTKSKKGK